jgi:hypothetical protein
MRHIRTDCPYRLRPGKSLRGGTDQRYHHCKGNS